MILSRRDALRIGGLLLAGLPFDRAVAQDAGIVDIGMRGNTDGSLVWFDPIGVLVRPGQMVRWTNKDPGNSHTATAYHPGNDGRPLRIPATAKPWDSGYLLPDQSFSLVLSEPGIYDYFCAPHEHAGMVGRLVVVAEGEPAAALAAEPIEAVDEAAFPSVEEIVRQGRVGAASR
jgi:plastocyanin